MSADHDYRPAWKKIANILVTIVIWILIAYAITTWIPALYNSPVGTFLQMIVAPILAPIDAIIPSVGGIGFGLLILVFGLSFVQRRFLQQ